MNITERKESIINNNSYLLEQLQSSSTPKIILGINEFTDKLIILFKSKRIRLDGIIDDFTQEKNYQGYPIKKMGDVVQKNSVIISSVIDGKLITALDRARSNGFSNILTYLELFLLFPKEIEIPHFCDKNFTDISKNKTEYNWLYDILDDNESKTVLQKIIDFRFNFFPDALRGFKFDTDKEYFDDFITFGDQEVFVDCGGYNGDTTLKFLRHSPNYKMIYFIEPAIIEYEKAKSNLANYSNIIFLNKAVFRRNSVTRFNSDSNFQNKIDDEGNYFVDTVKLDDVLIGPVSYIKMDVEGAEYDALHGAKETISNFHPKLAVCVYHDQSHFWKIPRLILSFRGDYSVYLRHYTQGILGTVMYFLPKTN
jgi:FkbM family methyltransferase